jgi:raffinose/stachyose/melibiose transport system permease protein
MGLTRYTRATLLRELALILVAALFCVPFYVLVATALDTSAQAFKAPLSFPWPPHWDNFSAAWNTGGQGGLAPALGSSVVITLGSVVGLIVLG